jgi:hypothetical protein
MAECNHCESFVTDDYARVFGDNENRVDDCRNCPTLRSSTEEPDDGREVLLRDVREPTERDRDGVAVGESENENDAEPASHDPTGRGGVTTGSAGEPASGVANDEDEDTGRIQAGLSAMVSALRS